MAYLAYLNLLVFKDILHHSYAQLIKINYIDDDKNKTLIQKLDHKCGLSYLSSNVLIFINGR